MTRTCPGSRPPRVGIFGVPGHNRGDDAIALALRDGLAAARPDLHIRIAVRAGGVAALEEGGAPGSAPGPVPGPGTGAGETGLLPFDRRRIGGQLALARAVAGVDLVLLGGGSLLQDRFGGGRLRGVLGYAWSVTALARALGRPLVSAPLGIDELTTPRGRRAAREILARLGTPVLRDRASAARAGALLPGIATRVLPDPAFGFRAGPPGRDRGAPISSGPSSSGLAPFVLAPALEAGIGAAERARITTTCLGIARALLHDPSARLVFLAMESRAGEEAGALAALRASLPGALQARVTLCHPATAAEAAAVLRGARGVVGMRLHALILGWGHVPLYALSRGEKTDALIAERGVPGAALAARSLEGHAAAACAALARPPAGAAERAALAAALAGYYAGIAAMLPPPRSPGNDPGEGRGARDRARS